MEIPKRTYYNNKDKKIDKDTKYYNLIKQKFEESKRTYGYRRITKALNMEGKKVSENKVRRIMRKFNIMPTYAKKFQYRRKFKRDEYFVAPNLVKRQFAVDKPNKIWVTDVTYLVFNGKIEYLSTILDLYDRSVVSYKIHKFNSVELAIDTLRYATLMRPGVKNVIIHSDQGVQYTSKEYLQFCSSIGFQNSMSRKGNPLDNAVIENWHSLLKKEVLYNNEIHSLEEYKALVFDWIWFYMHDRLNGR